jgi:hypothetical protein
LRTAVATAAEVKSCVAAGVWIAVRLRFPGRTLVILAPLNASVK